MTLRNSRLGLTKIPPRRHPASQKAGSQIGAEFGRYVNYIYLWLQSRERAFSQLKLILEAIGSQPLEDNVETRMLIRCNKRQYQ